MNNLTGIFLASIVTGGLMFAPAATSSATTAPRTATAAASSPATVDSPNTSSRIIATPPGPALSISNRSEDAASNADQSGVIAGTVVDSENGEGVPFAYLHLEEINRTATTDRHGHYELRNVPNGTYTVVIHRIGYHSQSQTITIDEHRSDEITFTLTPAILSGEAVQVVADAESTTGSNLEHASVKISGEQLRQDLGTTLSSTLSNQPGFSERSMGAASGRPVVRGLGDERVLILEDGERTGDVSWTSGDHAVTVDPSSADEIEIARGPAALEYGSGAIGGVINVVRNQIPTSVPRHTTGTYTLQGTSVNRGVMTGGNIAIPMNDLAVNIDLNGRLGHDMRTPVGTLTNTDLRSTSNAIGASYIQPWGYAGLSASMYLSNYGIPPDPEGGHAAGVNIEMSKYQTEGRAEILLPGSVFNMLEVRGSFITYQHTELEPSGHPGTEYDLNTTLASLKLRNGNWGPFDSGVIGVWGEHLDYSAFGSGAPDSGSLSGSLFAVQEGDFGPLHLEAGLRLNHVLVRPDEEELSPVIGLIRERTFTGLESSVSGILDVGRGLSIGSTLMHSWRAPSLEELYSEGPHLAAYAYEVGNPDLDAERGLGFELFTRFNRDLFTIEAAAYLNRFSNYLHAQDTGQPSLPRADLNEYRYLGTEATLYGAELAASLRLTRRLTLDGSFSMTWGDRVVSSDEMDLVDFQQRRQPLPMIPPLSGNIGLRYETGPLSTGIRARMAAEQTRLGEFETPTAGYTLVDLTSQYRFSWGTTLHTLSLNIVNLLDEEYYNHLSLVKDLFAEPGRSVNLLYRVYF